MTVNHSLEIKSGQIWRDGDPRGPARFRRIVHVSADKAVMVPCLESGRDIGLRRRQVSLFELAGGTWERVR